MKVNYGGNFLKAVGIRKQGGAIDDGRKNGLRCIKIELC